jgi:hypothetical protein
MQPPLGAGARTADRRRIDDAHPSRRSPRQRRFPALRQDRPHYRAQELARAAQPLEHGYVAQLRKPAHLRPSRCAAQRQRPAAIGQRQMQQVSATLDPPTPHQRAMRARQFVEV